MKPNQTENQKALANKIHENYSLFLHSKLIYYLLSLSLSLFRSVGPLTQNLTFNLGKNRTKKKINSSTSIQDLLEFLDQTESYYGPVFLKIGISLLKTYLVKQQQQKTGFFWSEPRNIIFSFLLYLIFKKKRKTF